MDHQASQERTLLSSGANLIIQPRDRSVLEKLSTFRLLTRKHIAEMAEFHSVTRVNVRLNKLRRAGLITRYFVSSSTGSRRSVYSLTRKGAHAAATTSAPPKWRADSVLTGNAFASHQLAVNDVYLAAFGRNPVPQVSWRSFSEALSARVKLIPDGLIEYTNNENAPSMFLEVDLGTEALPTWTRKAQLYLQLAESGEYRQALRSSRFAVLVVASDHARMQALRRHVAKQTQKLFWFSTLDIINRMGFWSSIWLRPVGAQQVPPGA